MASPLGLIVLPPLDKYNLVGTVIELMLFGFNCVLYIGAMYFLVGEALWKRSRWILIASSTLSFLIASAHSVLAIVQLFQGLIEAPQTGLPYASILYYADPTNGLGIAKNVLYTINVMLQDLILLWRMYVVWDQDWRYIAIPALVELMHWTFALTADGLNSQPISAGWENIADILGVYCSWSLDLLFNIGVTFLIAARLRWASKRFAPLGSGINKYTTIMLTIVESGAIFCGATAICFIITLCGDTLGIALLGLLTQLATLTLLLIIVRVGLGHKYANTSFTQSKGSTTRSPGRPVDSARRTPGATLTSYDVTTYGSNVVQVRIESEQDSDSYMLKSVPKDNSEYSA